MDATDAWQGMCDELTEEDLVLGGENAGPSSSRGIRQKQPDGCAVHWGHRVPYILEFTRPRDCADDCADGPPQQQVRRST